MISVFHNHHDIELHHAFRERLYNVYTVLDSRYNRIANHYRGLWEYVPQYLRNPLDILMVRHREQKDICILVDNITDERIMQAIEFPINDMVNRGI